MCDARICFLLFELIRIFLVEGFEVGLRHGHFRQDFGFERLLDRHFLLEVGLQLLDASSCGRRALW